MKAKRFASSTPSGPLVENAARIVRLRLDEMRSFAPAALRPEYATEQHDLRIAAKRLRYVLEATGFCFGAPADAARRRARDLQGVLGDLHDCDVMLPRIADHVGRLRAEDAGGDPRPRRARPTTSTRRWSPRRRTGPPTAGSSCSRSTSRRGGGCSSRASSSSGASSSATATWERLERAIDRELRESASARRRPSGPSGRRASSSAPSAPSARPPSAPAAAAAELAEARRAQGGPAARAPELPREWVRARRYGRSAWQGHGFAGAACSVGRCRGSVAVLRARRRRAPAPPSLPAPPASATRSSPRPATAATTSATTTSPRYRPEHGEARRDGDDQRDRDPGAERLRPRLPRAGGSSR